MPMLKTFAAAALALVLGVAWGCSRETAEQSAPTRPVASIGGPPAGTERQPAAGVERPAAAPSVTERRAAIDENTAAPPLPNSQPDEPLPHSRSAADGKELFPGWPQPQVALVISGEQLGYIEPCGCAGLENQKGGLSRRHSLLKQLADRGWPVVALDLGNQVRRFGAQQEIKFHTTVEALKTMGYGAVGFGPDDLQLTAGELLADVAGAESPFVSANVDFVGFEGLLPRFRVVEAGGRKIGVTSVLGQRYQQQVNNRELSFSPADEALAQVVAELKKQADFLVLLSHATREESKALAKRFPEFSVVVSAGGADEPPAQTEAIDGTNARLVDVGHKGMYVGVLGLFDDKQEPLRYQRVPLDKRLKDSVAMHALLVAYVEQLKERGFAGLGILPVAHPTGREFVGSETCGDCHSQAYEIWSKTGHAHATETLTHLTPARQFDSECISCHATGWEPQKYYALVSGFESLEKTPHLAANGCENCHGPGSAHVAAELGEVAADERQIKRLREEMRLTLAAAEATCVKCHDLDNSPEFNFETYWPEVEHRGKY